MIIKIKNVIYIWMVVINIKLVEFVKIVEVDMNYILTNAMKIFQDANNMIVTSYNVNIACFIS